MLKRLMEFFEDNQDRLSMSRFITLGAWGVSSIAFVVTPTVEMAAVYLGVWGALGANSKWQETRPEIAKAQAAAAPPVIKQENAINNVEAS
jgi:hypothetical protein